MTGILAIVAFGLLFAAFGLLLRGVDEAPRCASCDGRCGTTCTEDGASPSSTTIRDAEGDHA